MLLEFLHDLLPIGNLMPKTTHHVKKILANLGLSYEKIHACPNGCMLFWDGNEKEEVCSICGASRWKSAPEVASNDSDEVAPNDPDEVVGPQKKMAANILRWFPLKPRLQRLFMSSKTASLMNWHQQERKKDGAIDYDTRDGLEWPWKRKIEMYWLSIIIDKNQGDDTRCIRIRKDVYALEGGLSQSTNMSTDFATVYA
ncbi:hypothetical protein Tco_0001031 [Tanacetum coccineum]